MDLMLPTDTSYLDKELGSGCYYKNVEILDKKVYTWTISQWSTALNRCFAIDTDLSPSKASMKKYSLYYILFDEFLFGDLLNYLRGLPWQS
ncbi:hypothetical protein U3516DRAFT_780900 [Neocallimastix sp. 'constans']